MIWSFLCSLISAFKTRRELALENLALRQQLAVLCLIKIRSRLESQTCAPSSKSARRGTRLRSRRAQRTIRAVARFLIFLVSLVRVQWELKRIISAVDDLALQLEKAARVSIAANDAF